ncbi:MAG: Fe-S cluster assembly sulfur transfer protein SufU [Gammaproteobacteria bacterium]|jgi:nitrogen fixation NifU-like protein
MDLNDLYQELIIDHGTCPRNFSSLVNATVQEEGFNPLCGDQVILFLDIKDDLITQATFQGQGCAISTASASIMTESLIGKTKTQATQLVTDFTNIIVSPNNNNSNLLPDKLIALISVKNYPSRVKCATLAWHTLEAALKK